MLMSEYNREEEREVVREEALEEGRERGREEGLTEGREDGLMTTARNALAEGLTPEFVQRITGLDMAVIEALRDGQSVARVLSS
jgi:predicted transposase/invertase (TIGR01784 family)